MRGGGLRRFRDCGGEGARFGKERSDIRYRIGV